MSGPIERSDIAREDEHLTGIELREGRATEVGGHPVTRVLPTKGRRTVGAWCFVDLMGPADALDPDPLEVGPHPHIGLSTVTWLLDGEALHSDSLGTEQVVRPGQLNLMTAGHGIAHAELAAAPPFRGVQMWVAQPDHTRHGPSTFEHHADLPRVALEHGTALVFMGAIGDARSPARADTALLGTELSLAPGRTLLPTSPTFEHAVVPLDRSVLVGTEVIEPGWIGLVPAGPEQLSITAQHDDVRLLVLGGEPLGERVQMWWNFVGRDRAELTAAWRDWDQRTERFGSVPTRLERIEAPRPPWLGH